tara:strand:- start:4808 stop:5416 length:609 start_codon:yes stop_codon:yes gene_type:complete
MATIDDEIEAELEAKSIEKDISFSIDDIEEIEKPKKSKKVRSQAQIQAFEKARVKRAENFEKRKLLKEQEKLEKKEVKTKIKEEINNLSTEEIKEKIIKKTSKSLDNVVPPTVQHSYGHYAHQPPVINNYYYNTLSPDMNATEKRGRKKKVVYESDSDEEQLPEVKRTSKKLTPDHEPEPEPVPVPAPAPKTSTRKLKYNFV